jgi:hypothetical protein
METIRVEDIEPQADPNRYRFTARVAMLEGDSLLIHGCLLVMRYDGRHRVHPPSRFKDGKWVELVVWPEWLSNALREAVLRELHAQRVAQ